MNGGALPSHTAQRAGRRHPPRRARRGHRVGPSLLVLLAGTAALAPAARAEIYSYVDAEGVVHLTNVPDDPRYRPVRVQGARNTYTWRNDAGTIERIHRVSVTNYDELIVEAARYYTLPPALVKAVIAVESSFEPAAVSHAGAQGLMQLIPPTARQMHVEDPFDPRESIYGGARYLRILANRFSGDVRLTLAAYNAGPQAVERAGGIPSFEETRRYVERVVVLYHHYLSTWPTGAR